MKDFYYILGVSENASPTQIKEAYRKLSKKFHPDVNQGDAFFEQRFKDIQEAYEVLMDSALRSAYDKQRSRPFSDRAESKMPKIVQFTLSHKMAKVGETVTITWNVDNAASTQISLFGQVTHSGSKRISFKEVRKDLPIKITATAGYQKVEEIRYLSVLPVENRGAPVAPTAKQAEQAPVGTWSRPDMIFYLAGGAILLVLIMIALIGDYHQPSSGSSYSGSHQTTTPSVKNSNHVSSQGTINLSLYRGLEGFTTIEQFFSYMNDQQFSLAYGLTDNNLWKPLSRFRDGSWGGLTDFRILSAKEKNYWSKYDADQILQVRFLSFNTKDQKQITFDYDFHLRGDGNDYTIVRMIHPRTTNMPGKPVMSNRTGSSASAIASSDLQDPANYGHLPAIQTLKAFFRYLKDGEYQLAYQFTDNVLWTPFNRFRYDAWANLSLFEIVGVQYKDYWSKYDADQIWQLMISAFDEKHQELKLLNFDFHLRQEGNKWFIVRMIHPRDTDMPGRPKQSVAASNHLPANQSTTTATSNPGTTPRFSIKSPPIDYSNNSLSTGSMPYDYCYGSENNCLVSCSEIKVQASRNSDVLVIIKRYGRVYRHAYIKKGGTFTFYVHDGTYQPFFYYGKGWNPNKYLKTSDCGALKGGFIEDEYFSKDDPQTLVGTILTYELILQQNGNFRTKPSNLNEAF